MTDFKTLVLIPVNYLFVLELESPGPGYYRAPSEFGYYGYDPKLRKHVLKSNVDQHTILKEEQNSK